MRTCLIFIIVGWVALLAGTGYAASQQSPSESIANTSSDHARDAEHAAPASNRNRQADRKASTETAAPRRASKKDHARSPASLTKAIRPRQPSSNGEHSKSGSAINPRQPVLNSSSGVTKEGLIHNHNETLSRTQPVRPSGVVRTKAASLNNARHRGPNPAAIGGPASSDTRDTAAINGNHVGRRPGRN